MSHLKLRCGYPPGEADYRCGCGSSLSAAAPQCFASLQAQHSIAPCQRGVSFGCIRDGDEWKIWTHNCGGTFRCHGTAAEAAAADRRSRRASKSFGPCTHRSSADAALLATIMWSSPLSEWDTLHDFRGATYTTIASLYKAACAVRDGPDGMFDYSVPELARLLRNALELPADPAHTLRLRRVPSSTVQRSFFHLVADLSDGMTTTELSLKKACRAALKP